MLPATTVVPRGGVPDPVDQDASLDLGSAMIANKISGVYAAVCQDPLCAGFARSHSNTNVLCLGGKIIGWALALEIVRTWMSTDYLGGEEKYRRRVDKVRAIAAEHVRPLI